MHTHTTAAKCANTAGCSEGVRHAETMPGSRFQYWRLLELVVSQVILDGRGIDPSFTGKYNINVRRIIDGFVQTDQVRRAPSPGDWRHGAALVPGSDMVAAALAGAAWVAARAVQYKRMEQEVTEARARYKALQEARDKLDNEWAENFGAKQCTTRCWGRGGGSGDGGAGEYQRMH